MYIDGTAVPVCRKGGNVEDPELENVVREKLPAELTKDMPEGIVDFMRQQARIEYARPKGDPHFFSTDSTGRKVAFYSCVVGGAVLAAIALYDWNEGAGLSYSDKLFVL